jgi:UBX domain
LVEAEKEQSRLLKLQRERELMEKEEADNRAAKVEQDRLDEVVRKERLAASIPAEPANGVTLKIRMPDGKTTKRRFPLDGNVKSLYDFVDSKQEVVGQFTITTVPSNKVISDDLDISYKDAGLSPNGNVVVRMED